VLKESMDRDIAPGLAVVAEVIHEKVTRFVGMRIGCSSRSGD